MKTSGKAGSPGAWRAFLWAAVGFLPRGARSGGGVSAPSRGFDRGDTGVCCCGVVPAQSCVLPVLFFGFAMLLPAVFSLKDWARWAGAVFRVFMGDVEERFEQVTGRFWDRIVSAGASCSGLKPRCGRVHHVCRLDAAGACRIWAG